MIFMCKRLGLLATEVYTQGSRSKNLNSNSNLVQVSNQKLMKSGITNLSDSKPVAVYTSIEVDATIAPEAIDQLSDNMKAAAAASEDLFDQTFDSKAYIMNTVSPLKYQVSIQLQTSAVIC